MHNLKQEYMKALQKQLGYELKKQNKKIETIFIGGGTPSTIDPIEYNKILDIIKPYMLDDNIEITIEANPNSATKQWLSGIYDIGINRISFGVQSFDDDKLDFLGRNHNKSQAIDAIKNANRVGFENINLDIIYDTVRDTKELLKNDLEIIRNLAINHISAYSLTLEEGTKFFNKSDVKIENEKLARYLFDELNNLGFKQYEISNFAKSNSAKSKHNLGYWQYKEYLGVGCGAVGCIENTRYYNTNDLVTYIQDPLKYEQKEILSSSDVFTEKLLLGFRSEVGVDMDLVLQNGYKDTECLIDEKKIYKKSNRLYSYDFMIADELVLFLEN
jgi:oxygen-independent coproporphyrinogen-3 oxidase